MQSETMKIFNNWREQNIIELEHAKRNNQKIVGLYCAYSPKELIMAAGAIPVSLCGTKQEPIPHAEKVLPRNLCPLIKSSFGFAITGTCPYFRLSDFLIAETTCDGKKKMFELLEKYKPIHVLHLPQGLHRESALSWWANELRILKEKLEEHLSVSITNEDLRKAIKKVNAERREFKTLHEVNKANPAPLTGRDMLTAIQVKEFNIDDEADLYIKQIINEAVENARKEISPFKKGTPRILLTGCPVGSGSEKVLNIIEECGGSVVCFESCSGIKTMTDLVDEDEGRDPIEAIAERYLKIPCSCMTKNEGRFELIGSLIKEYQVDAIVDLTWQACHTYNVEAWLVRQEVKDKHGLPYIQLETDYSTSDVEQLKTRITAYIEMVGSNRCEKC